MKISWILLPWHFLIFKRVMTSYTRRILVVLDGFEFQEAFQQL